MTGKSRPYHHGNLREALLEAAEGAIETGGIDGLTLRELGRELGVSHTSPRRHFADKRALLDALAERGFDRLGVALGEAVADRGWGFDERLARLARAHVRFALEHPALFAWMFEAKNRPDAPRALLAAGDRVFAHASVVFRDGQASRSVIAGDPGHLGLVCFAAMQGLITISTQGKFMGAPLDTVVSDVIQRIILGLRPRG